MTPGSWSQSTPSIIPGTVADAWWNERVFYEIYVRSFQDSDGDGHGDLQGLISRLDYLEELGVGALWLMPVFDAKSQHGYDAIDYKSIEKDYGTLEDFKEFLAEAHKRDIKVILDLVLNHTSHQHPWFLEAVENPEGHRGEYYRFSDRNLGQYWRRLEGVKPARYFYGWFNATMPDLDYTNPLVTQEMFDTTRYWLNDVGVDGFRLDAIKYLIEVGNITENTPATHEWFLEFNKVVKETRPEAFLVGEAWDSLDVIASYTGGKMDVNFHFALSEQIFTAVQQEKGNGLRRVMEETLKKFPPGQYAPFIRNHDQQRLVRSLGGNRPKAKQAASILLTLPGVPFVYYGEELGLTQNRKAMQWEELEPHWGFTKGPRVYSNGTQEKESGLTVSYQREQKDSVWNHFRRLIALRNQLPALRTGALNFVETGNPSVLAWVRLSKGTNVLVVHNLASKYIGEYGLDLWEDLEGLKNQYQMVFPREEEAKGPRGGKWKPLNRLEPNTSYIWTITPDRSPDF